MSKVGLCMIVKNEAHVIERCLNSVRELIDHWLIVDTGSTDGTQEIVHRTLEGVPGMLYQRPWVDFGHNRTEAVQAARVCADYTLLLDADQVLEAPGGFTWPALETDVLEMLLVGGTRWRRHKVLVSNDRSWRFQGPLFETLETPANCTWTLFQGALVRELGDGHRHQGVSPIERNTLDARVLEAALRDDPDNARLHYYLAGCYRDSNRGAKAMEAYAYRVGLGGDPGEVAESRLQIAHQLRRSGADPDTVIAAYLNAWESLPVRAEPLVALAGFAREHARYAVARMAAEQAVEIPRPLIELPYVEEEDYAWRARDEFAVNSFRTARFAESMAASQALLAGGALPASELARVEENLRQAAAACGRPVVEPTVAAGPTGSVPDRPPVPEPADAPHRFGGFAEIPAAVHAANATLVIDLPPHLVTSRPGADAAVPPPR